MPPAIPSVDEILGVQTSHGARQEPAGNDGNFILYEDMALGAEKASSWHNGRKHLRNLATTIIEIRYTSPRGNRANILCLIVWQSMLFDW